MVSNKNEWNAGKRHFTKSQFKKAWRLYRKCKESISNMDWWLAGIMLQVDSNRFSPEPLICAQINRGQNPYQTLGEKHA